MNAMTEVPVAVEQCQSNEELYHSYSDFGTVRCFYLNGRRDADKKSWYTSLQACKYVTCELITH